MRTTAVRSALVAALVAVLAACSSATSPSGTGTGSSEPKEAPLVVFAPASLQGTFDDLSSAFTAANPEYAVAPITYDGSQALATQVTDGASVDVVAFADEKTLTPLSEADLVGDPTIFATNTLQIAVAPGNPLGITSLQDLARPGVSVVLCAAEVPCGAASRTLLDDQGVSVTPVSEETSVTAVVTRVSQGEADAGLVYATDVAGSDGKLEGVTPAGADKVVNRYPIAVSAKPASPRTAAAFETFVLSDAGRKILAEHGFGAP